MADPQAVYDAGDDRQRGLIRSVWPDLGAVMEAARRQTASTRIIVCATAPHPSPARAAGRITLNGHPACEQCLNGRVPYPLELQDPDKWER